jgi:hypothetical protein
VAIFQRVLEEGMKPMDEDDDDTFVFDMNGQRLGWIPDDFFWSEAGSWIGAVADGCLFDENRRYLASIVSGRALVAISAPRTPNLMGTPARLRTMAPYRPLPREAPLPKVPPGYADLPPDHRLRSN